MKVLVKGDEAEPVDGFEVSEPRVGVGGLRGELETSKFLGSFLENRSRKQRMRSSPIPPEGLTSWVRTGRSRGWLLLELFDDVEGGRGDHLDVFEGLFRRPVARGVFEAGRTVDEDGLGKGLEVEVPDEREDGLSGFLEKGERTFLVELESEEREDHSSDKERLRGPGRPAPGGRDGGFAGDHDW